MRLGMGLYIGSRKSSFDADAAAFFAAAGITNGTQQVAYNKLVTDLKAAGIWTKIQALYPFIGGSAAAHKWNGKDLRDLDAAFRITWGGTVTHDANGITPNGTTGFGDTFYGNANYAQNDAHLSIYSRTTGTTAGYPIGSGGESGGANTNLLVPRTAAGKILAQISYGFSSADASVSNADGVGFYSVSKNTALQLMIRKNDTNTTVAASSLGVPLGKINIGRLGGFNGGYSAYNLAFASIGLALSVAEAQALKDAVLVFQTTLGRA